MILHTIKKIIKLIFSVITAIILLPVFVNIGVISYGGYHIIDFDEAEKDYDCIMVLGCSVIGNKPSNMLKSRLDRALELYESGASDIIFMSGDSEDEYYDEVRVMKQYAVDNGVPEEAIVTDMQGYSTYESMYRAKNEFGYKKIIVVTQRYHLYRAVYDARLFGLDACGVVAVSENTSANDQSREFLARLKDFVFTILKPDPETISQYDVTTTTVDARTSATSYA